MSRCWIFAGGRITETDFSPKPDDLIIAADSGLKYLKEKGIEPDLIVGDFDSLGYKPSGSNVICHPPEKDDTDTMLAVNEALSRGYRDFVIFGSLGGRLGHTLANIQTAAYIAELGGRAFLVGDEATVTVIKDSVLKLDSSHSGYISVFSHSDISEGVDINGLKYLLSNATLTSSNPLGVSNEFIGQEAAISVRKGILAIAFSGNIN